MQTAFNNDTQERERASGGQAEYQQSIWQILQPVCLRCFNTVNDAAAKV
jgi:hypothetical protein